MKRLIQSITLVSLFVFILNLGFNDAQAASTPKKELMITSFETSESIYAGKQAKYTVFVSSIDPKAPKKTMAPYKDANVTLYFKNGSTVIKSKPKLDTNGTYRGTATLPDTGSWDVLVMALRKGEKEASDQSNVFTMTTQWDVHPPKGQGSVWLIGLGLIILLLVVYFLIGRVRRYNQKKR